MLRVHQMLGIPLALTLIALPGPARADHPELPEGFHLGMWEHFRDTKGRVGIELQPMTPELREYFEIDPDFGVLVARVESDSPAEKAGIRVGDVVLKADDQAIHSPRQLIRLVHRQPQGESLEMTLSRKGKERKVELVPRGDPRIPYAERLRPFMGKAFRTLREHMHALEQRLEELEKRMESDDPSVDTDQT